MVEDSEMAGADAAAEESDNGSEDLEAESSGSEDEAEEEDEEVEGDADESMEVDGSEKPMGGMEHHAADAVMAH